MNRPTVLIGEHVVPWVVVGSEECALTVLNVASAAQRANGGVVDRDCSVGVAGLASRLVASLSADDDSVVVQGDLAGVEIHGIPLSPQT